MRLRHPDGSVLHIAYCTNVHPADDLDGIAAQLERYAARVRDTLDVPVLGVGLWVAAPALADEAAADRLAKQLDHLGLEVVTLNGFPYAAFHAPVVKRDVYRPNWAQDERRRYTLELARLLARLLPDDVAEGSISTLPLGWHTDWDSSSHAAALGALEALAGDLAAIEDATGKRIRLALEPEPGCTIETVGQACDVLAGLAPDWIGVCLDACHLAVQFEQPAETVTRLRTTGVPVVKTQVSNALRVPRPATPEGQELLARFDEPRFLHQVRTRHDGRVEGVDDLPAALAGGLPSAGEWRVHYHVPVTSAEHTTRDELSAVLAALAGTDTPLTRHFEVETYTWTVMRDAPGDDDSLVAALAAELVWTRDQLIALGAELVR
jgi:sugar phosphate isomerase/epimerase